MDAQSRYPTPSSPTRTRRAWMMSLYTVLAVVLAVALAVSALWQFSAGQVAAHTMTTTPPGPSSSACTNVVTTGGGSCVNGPAVLTPFEQMILARKNALAQEWARVRAGTLSYVTYQRDWQAFMRTYGGPTSTKPGVSPACLSGPAVGCGGANSLNMTQEPQQTYYYCGPAAAEEVLGVRGVNASRKTLAGSSYLKTDANGQTSWSPQVMEPTLNTLTKSSYYVTVNGSGAGGGGFSTSTWENDLIGDVDNGWALAGNTVEYNGTGPHLVGHPSNLTIYHWIGISGYSNYGSYTLYADSIHGTGFWPWAPNVPAFSYYSSSDMTTLLNGRGVVW